MYLKNNTILQGGRYRIVRHISSGGFGNTYEGVHTMLDTRVAIKEFFPKRFCNRDENTSHITVPTQDNRELVDKLHKKFIEEAKAVFKMNHPNIVKVHDIFEENGTAYYVMDFIDGRSLGDIVKQRGPLSEAEALGYIRQVADALRYVHSLNRLHLDIKPGNIMVDASGHAMLIDFGASKHYDAETGENTSTLLGLNTPGYAPAEQSYRGFVQFAASTDIYALGATLYKLLTGKTPPDAQMLKDGEVELPPLPSHISASVKNAVKKSMRPLRKNRPQSIDEFLKLLDAQTVVPDVDDESTLFTPEMQREEENRKRKEAEAKAAKERTEAEARARAEAERKAREEEQKRKKEEEEKARKAPRNKAKKVWVGVIAGIVAVVGVTIGVKITSSTSVNDNIKEIAQETEHQDISSKTFTVNGVSFEMMNVQAGTFTMGATSEMEAPDDDEKPTHQVTLTNDYYIGKTEVTQALWKAVMGSNPSEFKGDNLPVEYVSWNDCQEFISKLNSMTGENFRLPTEAEWEFAARGGNNSNHYQYSGSNNLDDVAWYDDNSGNKTHPVATKQPNELGIYDMSGNVREWCSDRYGDYSSGSQTNPTGPDSGSFRVLRGGGRSSDARYCRSSHRFNYFPDDISYFGLRLVLVP